ncbi:hypothetical protein BKA93DRAFT_794939 [Sparassis latifolia]
MNSEPLPPGPPQIRGDARQQPPLRMSASVQSGANALVALVECEKAKVRDALQKEHAEREAEFGRAQDIATKALTEALVRAHSAETGVKAAEARAHAAETELAQAWARAGPADVERTKAQADALRTTENELIQARLDTLRLTEDVTKLRHIVQDHLDELEVYKARCTKLEMEHAESVATKDSEIGSLTNQLLWLDAELRDLKARTAHIDLAAGHDTNSFSVANESGLTADMSNSAAIPDECNSYEEIFSQFVHDSSPGFESPVNTFSTLAVVVDNTNSSSHVGRSRGPALSPKSVADVLHPTASKRQLRIRPQETTRKKRVTRPRVSPPTEEERNRILYLTDDAQF